MCHGRCREQAGCIHGVKAVLLTAVFAPHFNLALLGHNPLGFSLSQALEHAAHTLA